LSDGGDDPRLSDRVEPPVSEREETVESDKWSRRRPKRTSGRIGQATESDKRLNRTSGGVGPRLGWKIREEARPKIRKKGISEIKIGFLNLPRLLKICRRRFRRNFDMRFFLNSSRLLKDFRKI
jgi:hypothetical protein